MTETTQTLGTAADEKAVEELFARMTAAWNAQDADAISALYRTDATVATSRGVTWSREELHGYMSAGFAGPLKGTRSVEKLERVRFVSPEVAVVNAISGFLLPGEDEVRDDIARRATWVLTQEGGDWFFAAYHNSAL